MIIHISGALAAWADTSRRLRRAEHELAFPVLATSAVWEPLLDRAPGLIAQAFGSAVQSLSYVPFMAAVGHTTTTTTILTLTTLALTTLTMTTLTLTTLTLTTLTLTTLTTLTMTTTAL